MKTLDRLIVALVVVGVLLAAAFVEAQMIETDAGELRVHYAGVPIAITLAVHEETRLRFQESVEIGLSPPLAGQLEITNVHGIVYLTALRPFEPSRVAVKGLESGRFVLLDLDAKQEANSHPDIHVVHGKGTSNLKRERSYTALEFLEELARLTLDSQTSAALPRGISLASIQTPPNAFYRDIDVESKQLGAFRTKRWLGFVVEVENVTEVSVDLDPDAVGGVWHAAGFLHTRLLPASKRGSSSVMFLVKSRDRHPQGRG